MADLMKQELIFLNLKPMNDIDEGRLQIDEQSLEVHNSRRPN